MPDDRTKLIDKARAEARRGRLRRATDLYERAVASAPDDARGWLALGDLYRRSGDADAAAGAYRRAGRAYAGLGFAARALAAYRQALRIDDGDPDTHAAVAELHLRLGHTADARDAFVRAAERFEARGDAAGAARAVGRAAAIEPVDVGLLRRAAELAAAAGDRDAARAHRLAAADWYMRVGDALRAVHVLRPAYEAEPTRVDVLDKLAQAFAAAGRADKVAMVRAERARLSGGDGGTGALARGTEPRGAPPSVDTRTAAMFAQAMARLRAGDRGGAARMLRAILADRPDHAEARAALEHLDGG